MTRQQEITILGSGAMGSYYGAQLQAAGADVLLLDIWQEHIDRINTDGLLLTRPDASEDVLRMRAAISDADSHRLADLVIVFVDTNALDAALPVISTLLKPEGCVLTLQNGIGNVEKLSAAIGQDRVIAGTSMNSCELIGPGHVRHVIHGSTVLGEPGGNEVSPRVRALGAMLATADGKIETVADIMPHVWSKLVINCAVNPLCALTGLLPGQLQEVAETKALQAEIVAEIEALCAAKAVTLPEKDPIGEVWQKSRGGNNKPSMVQHLDRGRKTEIDALNGAVARMANEAGTSAPANTTITRLVKGLESVTATGV